MRLGSCTPAPADSPNPSPLPHYPPTTPLSPLLPISVAHSISVRPAEKQRVCIPDLQVETRGCCHSCMLSGTAPPGWWWWGASISL